MTERSLVWFLLVIAAVLDCFAGANAAKPKVVNDGTVIQNVTVISPERSGPLVHAVVVVRDGRIAEVGTDLVAGPQAKQIDGHGGFLIPGLIDSHVHVGNMGPLNDNEIEKHPDLLEAYRVQLPRSFLAFGFTTLVDLNLREKTLDWFNATPIHPNLCHCGRGVHVVGGYGALQTPKDAASANAANIVYQPEQAKDWPPNLDPKDYTPARAVDRVADASAICLKVFVEPGFGGAAHWPVPQPATLAALRSEASCRGLVMVVHANALESWRAALDAHADVIAHGLWHWPGKHVDPSPPREAREVIKAAANAHVGVQPTLQAVYGDLSIFDKGLLQDPRLKESLPGVLIAYLKSDEGKTVQAAVAMEYKQAIAKFFGSDSIDALKVMSIAAQRASATLRIMVAENAKLLFGTDTPSNEGIGNPPGLNGRLELGRWVEAGVPLQEILRAATLDNAVAFGLADRGTIEPGKRADFLLLREDPLKSVAAYDSIDSIFLNGELLPRKSLLPEK
jgi:imidazolonepropionase-like amidohydrolase